MIEYGRLCAGMELEVLTGDLQKSLLMAHGDGKAVIKMRKIKKKDHRKNGKRIMKDGLGEASAADVAWANSLSDSQLVCMYPHFL